MTSFRFLNPLIAIFTNKVVALEADSEESSNTEMRRSKRLLNCLNRSNCLESNSQRINYQEGSNIPSTSLKDGIK